MEFAKKNNGQLPNVREVFAMSHKRKHDVDNGDEWNSERAKKIDEALGPIMDAYSQRAQTQGESNSESHALWNREKMELVDAQMMLEGAGARKNHIPGIDTKLKASNVARGGTKHGERIPCVYSNHGQSSSSTSATSSTIPPEVLRQAVDNFIYPMGSDQPPNPLFTESLKEVMTATWMGMFPSQAPRDQAPQHQVPQNLRSHENDEDEGEESNDA